MKIRNLVLGMMACAAFTACTNEEIIDNAGNKLEGDAYVAVNIVSTSGNTRALGAIENGTNEENKVASAMFFFFDANGNGCATPSKPSLDFTDAAGAASVISKAVLILENATSIPASIVAVMNPSTEIASLTSTTSLATLRTTVAKATAVGSFIMSNSAFADGNKSLVDATPISAANICTSSADALNAPVNIPVERVVAKVSANLNSKTSEGTFLIDGVNTKINVKLLGWKATALNPESNLIKSIDPTWTMDWWNDAASSRSYWGTSKAATDYTYFSHTAIAANNAAEYCLENTTATTTKLIVGAQLQTENGTPISLMEWKGAKNTVNNMKVVLTNLSDVKKYYTKTGTDTYTSLATTHIDFTAAGTSEDTRYTVIAKLADNAPQIYTLNGNTATEVTAETVNATLKALGEIKYWNGGASYFYIDIEHNGADGLGKYGIIRNHSYALTINSVTGLGTPVPNPSEDIIPEKPKTDDNSFIAATVQVLGWKIVSQTVDLTDK